MPVPAQRADGKTGALRGDVACPRRFEAGREICGGGQAEAGSGAPDPMAA